MNRLIPELDVSDLERSLRFYRKVVGCEVFYERPEERFAFLNLEGAQFMLEEAAGPGRRFRTVSLEFPSGRGVNFQIEVSLSYLLPAKELVSHAVSVMEQDYWQRQ